MEWSLLTWKQNEIPLAWDHHPLLQGSHCKLQGAKQDAIPFWSSWKDLCAASYYSTFLLLSSHLHLQKKEYINTMSRRGSRSHQEFGSAPTPPGSEGGRFMPSRELAIAMYLGPPCTHKLRCWGWLESLTPTDYGECLAESHRVGRRDGVAGCVKSLWETCSRGRIQFFWFLKLLQC